MRIFARAVTCSWMNGVIIRSARSASMTHVRGHGSSGYASDGRRLIPILSCRRHPIFRCIEASITTPWAKGRRFRELSEPGPKRFPAIIRCRYLSRYRDIRRIDETIAVSPWARRSAVALQRLPVPLLRHSQSGRCTALMIPQPLCQLLTDHHGKNCRAARQFFPL